MRPYSNLTPKRDFKRWRKALRENGMFGDVGSEEMALIVHLMNILARAAYRTMNDVDAQLNAGRTEEQFVDAVFGLCGIGASTVVQGEDGEGVFLASVYKDGMTYPIGIDPWHFNAVRDELSRTVA